MSRRVVCVGDVMIDVVAWLPGELAVGSDTPAPISLLGGGSAANTAAWLAHTGVVTTFVGRVGDDVLGQMVVRDLERAGVGLGVSIDPIRPTGTCIVLVDASGERTMVPSPGANSGLGEESVARYVDTHTHLHVSAYGLFNAGARPAVEALRTRAAELGVPVSVDAASSAPLRDFGVERFLAWLGADTLLFANIDEARVLSGGSDPDGCARILAQRCKAAIVKCGAEGAVWSDGTRNVRVTAEPHTAIDSTGAGDAFAAGVIGHLIDGDDIASALRAGNELAATALAKAGGRP